MTDERIEQTRSQFADLDDDQATALAGRMFVRAFDDLVALGCPLNCAFGGILRASVTETLQRAADPAPLCDWMRAIADELEQEAKAREGRVQ